MTPLGTAERILARRKKRVFVPRAHTNADIDRWEWTRRNGVICVCKNGLRFKSVYTLPELLKTERPTEVFP